MTTEGFHLDGNGIAGTLGEIFTMDITSAERICQSCGTRASSGFRHSGPKKTRWPMPGAAVSSTLLTVRPAIGRLELRRQVDGRTTASQD